jgi:NADPH:quinone reductase-like Zn-dependent oxidoreductase
MTRVVRFHETGGPEVLRFENLDIGAPGKGEMRVRVEAIGLNRAEASFRAGRYLEAAKLPARVGYEASAVIETLGEGVTGFAPGEAVSVIPAFSMNRYGIYAEAAIVPASAVVKRPAGLGPVEAAAVWMQYLTAYGALIDIARIAKGDAVLIPAASSSVGLAAIQLCNQVGAVPIASTRTSAKAAALREAGAAHVIATTEQDLVAEIMRITGGQGARVIFDPVAGPGVEKLVDAVKHRGILIVYGNLSGQPTPFPRGASRKALTMRGYTLFEITSDAERRARAIDFVTRGLEAGSLKPIVDKTFPLERIVDAHRYLESNQQFGKIIVTVGG